jgi:hypothetical protein
MSSRRSRGLRTYIRRRKAQIRRGSDNPEGAIEALMRQFPHPTRAEDDGQPGPPPSRRPGGRPISSPREPVTGEEGSQALVHSARILQAQQATL